MRKSKFFKWMLRVLLLAMAVYTGWHIYKLCVNGSQFTTALQTNGAWNMLWMTGLVILPVTIVYVFVKPAVFLENGLTFGLAFVFYYAVMVMMCVLKADVNYCYYYGRYLAPYVVIAVFVCAIVWNRINQKAVVCSVAISCIMVLPFDITLLTELDDTRMPYSTLTDYMETISNAEDSAVLMSVDMARKLLIPTKAVSPQTDVYFTDSDDIYSQLDDLEKKYKEVYYIVGRSGKEQIENYSICLRQEYFSWNDNNISNRMEPIPFPTKFTSSKESLTVFYNRSVDLISTSSSKNGDIKAGQIVTSG